MELFLSVLNQMLYLFACILIGYWLRVTNRLPANASTVVSKIESLVIMPAMIINSFSSNCTYENLRNNVDLILYGLFFMVVQTALAYVLLPLFTKEKKEKGVYLYSLAVVNFGFMGNSLISGIYGSEMLFRYLIFTIPTLMMIYSVGVMWLSPQKEKFSVKSLFSPMFGFMAVGMVLGITQLKLPLFVTKTISGLNGCYSPLAMLLTGLVIGAYDIKKLLGNRKVYLLTLIRCIVLPLIYLGTGKLIGLDKGIMILMAFITAMPLGLNTIVLPSSYGEDANLGASMAVISNVAGLVTVPLILSIFL